jgi:hypothetical protein
MVSFSCSGLRVPRAYTWLQKEYPTHAEAINHLFDVIRSHSYKASPLPSTPCTLHGKPPPRYTPYTSFTGIRL